MVSFTAVGGSPLEVSRAVFPMPPSCWLKSLGFPSGHEDWEEWTRSNKAPSVVRLLAQRPPSSAEQGRKAAPSTTAEVGRPRAPAVPLHRLAFVCRDLGRWTGSRGGCCTFNLRRVGCVRWEGSQGAVKVDCNSAVKHNKSFWSLFLKDKPITPIRRQSCIIGFPWVPRFVVLKCFLCRSCVRRVDVNSEPRPWSWTCCYSPRSEGEGRSRCPPRSVCRCGGCRADGWDHKPSSALFLYGEGEGFQCF